MTKTRSQHRAILNEVDEQQTIYAHRSEFLGTPRAGQDVSQDIRFVFKILPSLQLIIIDNVL